MALDFSRLLYFLKRNDWTDVARYLTDNVAPSGSVSPSNTVTGPDSFGAGHVVGTSLTYSRGDHDHGLPAITSTVLSPAAATSVTGPDVFGAASAVGTSNFYARQDHDHGLPTAPQTILDRSANVTVPDHCCVVSVDYYSGNITLQGDAAMAII